MIINDSCFRQCIFFPTGKFCCLRLFPYTTDGFLFKISWLVGLHLLSLFSFWRRHFPVYPHVRLLVAWFFCLTVSVSLKIYKKKLTDFNLSYRSICFFLYLFYTKVYHQDQSNGIMHNIIFCSHILLLDPSSLLYSERSKRWIDA